MSSGTSYNGWPANSDPNAIGIDKNWGSKVGAPPFGSGGFSGGMKSGDVSTVFVYLVTRLHNEVEPMMSEGSNLGYGAWGYSYRANVNNPSTLSCHASGTAIDYNAPKHPNGTSTGPNGGGGWSGSQYNAIKAILNGPLQQGIKWLTSNDPMHFEIGVGAQKLASIAASLGGVTPIPPEPEDDMPYSPDQLVQFAASGFARGAKDELLAIGDGPEKEPQQLTLERWAKVTNDRLWSLEQAQGVNATDA